MEEPNNRITLRSLIIGTLFAGLFAYLTVYFENRKAIILTATQVSVLPYVLLLFTVWMINPLCRLFRIVRSFSMAEVLIIFVMGAVSSGISTFGLASQIVPVMGNLFNKHWNNEQTKWDFYVEPFMSESFFLAEPGIQEKAVAYREAAIHYEEVDKILSRAKHLDESNAAIGEARAKLEAARASGEPEASKTIKLNRAESALRYAEKALKQAEELWQPYQQTHRYKQVLTLLPPKVEKAKADLESRQKALRELEEKAFEKVEIFRRGIRHKDKKLRAIPGIFPQQGEPVRMYLSRVQRLRCGLAAAKPLRRLREALLAHGDETAPGTVSQEVDIAAGAAIGSLEPVSDTSELERLEKELQERHDGLASELETETKALIQRNKTRRLVATGQVEVLGDEAAKRFERVDDELRGLIKELKANVHLEREKSAELLKRISELSGEVRKARGTFRLEEMKWLEDEIRKLTKGTASLKRRIARVSIELEKARKELEFAQKVGEVIKRLEELRRGVATDEAVALADVQRELDGILAEFRKFDGTLRRFLVGDIEWNDWLRPLFNWGMVILLTYVILMTFNVLIFRQWAHNEKLIYPLAELPEILAGHEPGAKSTSALPPIFRSGLFWAGFAISGVLLGYNLFAKSQVLSGFKEISLTFGWADYVRGSIFSGLYYSRCHIFFTMVGLSFLIPAKISFSLWFFYLVYLAQLQSMVWAGHGVNERSFPTMWWYTLNFKTAEAGGALMVFAAVILWKCRRYLLCFFTPSFIKDLEPDEQSELKASSFLFIGSSIAFVLFLWLRMGANLYYTIFTYFVIVVITIGLIRAVAEGGILGFQCWCGPFHFIRSIFGMDKAWTSPTLFGPLMVYYSLMFLDIKTFIAPAMANSIKIRDDLRMSRMRFHLAIILGIGIAAVVAILSQIILSYNLGADEMQGWFHTSFPRGLFRKLVSITKNRPIDTTAGGFWLGFGAVAMGLLLYFRQFIFWLPHPIGMIMLVNPIMQTYWFSIFLGWLFKSLVTKYGNKDTYKNMRCMFVGLIVGELIVIVLAMVVTIWLGKPIRIDLNRN